MRYLPHTSDDIADMLRAVGAESLDDLFSSIPEDCRFKGELNLPQMTEWELYDHMAGLAGQMAASPEYRVFVGAGSYNHHIPSSVRYLISRSEFMTAYTPYQPEISQGTLQAIFEYQTLTARLLGMEVANASMYDGASALAEALLMAIRVGRGKKKTVAVSALIHPMYRKVIQTYFDPTDFKIVELPYRPDGTTDLSAADGIDDLAAIAVQSPNFFGCIEDVQAASDKAHGVSALSVVGFTEPLAFGLFRNPGSQGADIVCGEGQSMGIPQSFGGPGLGMFASLSKYVRNMPGRLIGQTTDEDGKRGYVLTLATREQHIRREKATSNICSNQGLCATLSTMYMASLGGTGIRQLARRNYDKAEYLKSELRKAGLKIPFGRASFNEFVAEFPEGSESSYDALVRKKIIAGIPMECYYGELRDHYLLCVTETMSKADMDELVREVK
ncbi:glycine dehydrogenase [Desulfonema ishimotonii]|uniref:Probable glycine dehydrogenase (decarboxylating) subunit 1 n=1 Tax=Desulfonema ishimotonii TaxID=45657 RepID=A0A401G292_9BACT|nr:aminomethyl-transferring glycine dehydrogenase subunit GcvPA [Desulfonema ishimotonii]GBC63362.1 glycine dehydrogenase [Desulfonema ishimotonii]